MKFGTSAFVGLAHLGPAYGRENYSTTYAEMDGELVFALDRGPDRSAWIQCRRVRPRPNN